MPRRAACLPLFPWTRKDGSCARHRPLPACFHRRGVSGNGEVTFLRSGCRGRSPMTIVSFSPADDLLLVAGNDNVVRLYEVAAAGAGARHEYMHHKDAVRGQGSTKARGGDE
jgi:hypothetical protein